MKNNLLTWDYRILCYFRFQERNPWYDEIWGNSVTVLATSGTSPYLDTELTANDICYPFTKTEELIEFVGGSPINDIELDRRMTASEDAYSYSMSIWIKTKSGTGTSASPYDAKYANHLVRLKGVFTLYLSSPNVGQFFFEFYKNYFEFASNAFSLPLG